MLSSEGERAIEDALSCGQAFLKFISPNDAGATGGHQSGFYLPTSARELFTPQPPVKGLNHKHDVTVTWQDGRRTNSVVTWYGTGTRSEYRLTRFGRGFPFLNPDSVGNLLVLIPIATYEFSGYVLDREEDIEALQTALGVNVQRLWDLYGGPQLPLETPSECIDHYFRDFVTLISSFPKGEVFSQEAMKALEECLPDFTKENVDDRLVQAIDAEHQLFRMAERKLCGPEVSRLFEGIDDFLKTAQTIVNRRRVRAGRSWENHFAQILDQAKIPFDYQPPIDGKPDLVIPSTGAYNDSSYPTDSLFVVGLKTTCKDRWRQVLNEGRRVEQKHLATLQQGISLNQLNEMASVNVSLIVPADRHALYPKGSSMNLMSVEQFIGTVRSTLANA